MIKVVILHYVHFPEWHDTYWNSIKPARTELRMLTWKPDSSTELVSAGYSISVDVESSIEDLMATAQYSVCPAEDPLLVAGAGHITSVSGFTGYAVELVPAAPAPKYQITAHLLGHYGDVPVYALLSPTRNCSVTLSKQGYKESVVYNEETVAGTLRKCVDAAFFTDFLQDKLAAFEPT